MEVGDFFCKFEKLTEHPVYLSVASLQPLKRMYEMLLPWQQIPQNLYFSLEGMNFHSLLPLPLRTEWWVHTPSFTIILKSVMSGHSLISSDAYKCWLHVIHIKSWCHYKVMYGCNVWTLRYALTHTVHYMTRCWYVIASPDTYTYESNTSLFLLLPLYPSSSSPP